MKRQYYATAKYTYEVSLYRFDSKKERDHWVEERPDYRQAVTAKDAKLDHKEQLIYWKQKDSLLK